MPRARVDENISLGVGRNARRLTHMDVVGELQKIGSGIEGDFRYGKLSEGRDSSKHRRRDENLKRSCHWDTFLSRVVILQQPTSRVAPSMVAAVTGVSVRARTQSPTQ